MARNKRKKKTEFSKIILVIVSAFAVMITFFTMSVVVKTGDTSPLGYLVPAIFAELATATGFYYSKAKAENKIKLAKRYGTDAIGRSESEEF